MVWTPFGEINVLSRMYGSTEPENGDSAGDEAASQLLAAQGIHAHAHCLEPAEGLAADDSLPNSEGGTLETANEISKALSIRANSHTAYGCARSSPHPAHTLVPSVAAVNATRQLASRPPPSPIAASSTPCHQRSTRCMLTPTSAIPAIGPSPARPSSRGRKRPCPTDATNLQVSDAVPTLASRQLSFRSPAVITGGTSGEGQSEQTPRRHEQTERERKQPRRTPTPSSLYANQPALHPSMAAAHAPPTLSAAGCKRPMPVVANIPALAMPLAGVSSPMIRHPPSNTPRHQRSARCVLTPNASISALGTSPQPSPRGRRQMQGGGTAAAPCTASPGAPTLQIAVTRGASSMAAGAVTAGRNPDKPRAEGPALPVQAEVRSAQNVPPQARLSPSSQNAKDAEANDSATGRIAEDPCASYSEKRLSRAQRSASTQRRAEGHIMLGGSADGLRARLSQERSKRRVDALGPPGAIAEAPGRAGAADAGALKPPKLRVGGGALNAAGGGPASGLSLRAPLAALHASAINQLPAAGSTCLPLKAVHGLSARKAQSGAHV